MKGPRIPRWLYPGMHLKRWLVLLSLGITILGLGAAILLIDFYRGLPDDSIIFWLTGAGIDRPIRAILVAAGGLLLVGFGVWGLTRSVVALTRGWKTIVRCRRSIAVLSSASSARIISRS